jgi:archaellum component FlaC
MARKKAGKEKARVVIDDDDDEEFEIGIKGGEVERYEVKVEPPIISGRKSKAVRTPDEGSFVIEAGNGGTGDSSRGRQGSSGITQSVGSSQQIYKIEDDLRRTRDTVEDLRHTVDVLEGDFKDLKAEMDRISYLLRSLEGLKNTMKDIESTVSELSGLYDMISANVNPFIDIEPFKPSNGNGINNDRVIDQSGKVLEGRDKDEEIFSELSEIFTEEDVDEAERITTSKGSDLRSDEWTLRWTQFLIEKVGKEGLERTLDYYKDLNWIDEGVIDKVLDIARGTAGPPRKREEGRKVRWRLNADDHARSLEFIRNIRGK